LAQNDTTFLKTYALVPDTLGDFDENSRAWMKLIEDKAKWKDGVGPIRFYESARD